MLLLTRASDTLVYHAEEQMSPWGGGSNFFMAISEVVV